MGLLIPGSIPKPYLAVIRTIAFFVFLAWIYLIVMVVAMGDHDHIKMFEFGPGMGFLEQAIEIQTICDNDCLRLLKNEYFALLVPQEHILLAS